MVLEHAKHTTQKNTYIIIILFWYMKSKPTQPVFLNFFVIWYTKFWKLMYKIFGANTQNACRQPNCECKDKKKQQEKKDIFCV